ncbi:hypothetical protein DCCM_3639 [Desulfocucumis palustris]|uniref:Uncharacterized protein n=1 Tax=Desulfocucumis palustris TaxID=1898651 RepID=A0A2L2XKR6_9FIRM|nr:hypothetical protein DCCM_3639 [Desulfocucumis palustris]
MEKARPDRVIWENALCAFRKRGRTVHKISNVFNNPGERR